MPDPCPHGMPTPASCWELHGRRQPRPAPGARTAGSRLPPLQSPLRRPLRRLQHRHPHRPTVDRLSNDTHRHHYLGCLP